MSKKKKSPIDDVMCSNSFSSTDDDDGENFLGFSRGDEPSLSCYGCGVDFSLATTSTDDTTICDLKQVLKYGMRWHCPSCLNIPHGKIQSTKVDKLASKNHTSTVSAAKSSPNPQTVSRSCTNSLSKNVASSKDLSQKSDLLFAPIL